MSLTIKEFIKLSEEEKCERYGELSDYDMFLWRVGYEPLKGKTVGKFEMSEEKKREVEKEMEEFIIEVEKSKQENKE